MTEAPQRAPGPRRLQRVLFGAGDGIASTIYGTIVAMATLSVAYSTQKDLLGLAAIVASTALVLWVAHLYSHAISERIAHGRRLTFPEIRSIARRELGILLAAVLPVAVLLVGTLELVKDSTAVWIAMGVGLATLAAEALRYARLERLGPGPTIVALVLNLALGSLVVLLKIGIEH